MRWSTFRSQHGSIHALTRLVKNTSNKYCVQSMLFTIYITLQSSNSKPAQNNETTKQNPRYCFTLISIFPQFI